MKASEVRFIREHDPVFDECTHGIRHTKYSNRTRQYYCGKCSPEIGTLLEDARRQERAREARKAKEGRQ